MNVSVGRGNNRRVVTVPSVQAGRISQSSKIEREQAIDSLKSYLFRPKVLLR